MLNNYQYFIALAEEQNISKAAKKLYISHQCLSKYLKNLEQEYQVEFFERTPKLMLTPAGQAFLDTVRQIQTLEWNLSGQLHDIKTARHGFISFGTTEGRYRVLVPDLLTSFQEKYPNVVLNVQYGTTQQLSEDVLDNKLDIALLNQNVKPHYRLDIHPVSKEKMYLVISDKLLERYFPEQYPQCKQKFEKGVELSQFQRVPFVVSREGMNARNVLDRYLQNQKFRLNVAAELTQSDLHFMLTARDYGASLCWAMYTPLIHELNLNPQHSHLNIFPIKGTTLTNQIMLVTRKGKIFPSYGNDLMSMVRNMCTAFVASEAEKQSGSFS